MLALIEAIKEKTNVSKELEGVIASSFVRKKYPKGSTLLTEGQYCKSLYFLESGMIRSFFQGDGVEVTNWFYREDMFFSSWYGFYTGQPGYETIETLEDVVVYEITHDKFEELLDSFQMFERFARILAQEQVALVDSFSKGYMFLSAKEKYELILSYIPDIEQRVKLGQLASFLGISQETLSRVRGKK